MMLRFFLSLFFAALIPAISFAQSAWVPPKTKFIITPIYVFENASDFYFGSNRQAILGSNTIEQHTFTLATEYGITDRWAADLALGYTSSTLKNNNLGDLQDNRREIGGLNDTTVGLRYKLVDEFETKSTWIPTLTLRTAAIIEGTYKANLFQSPGDGASGGQFGVLFGKSYDWLGGIGYYGGVSYRMRSENVPNDLLSNVGIYKTIYKGLALNVGYRDERTFGGGISVDELVASLPAGPAQFQQLEDTRSSIEAGINYRDGQDRIYGFGIGKTISGANTFDRTSFSSYASFPF
jgi:hypothetical protein